MGLFSDPNEAIRKENLQIMEDKRLRFAELLKKDHFDPEYMLLLSTNRGGLVGLCRDDGQICLITGPDFGGEGEFVMERHNHLNIRRESYFEAAEGMGGIFGFGKKGAAGFFLIIDLEGEEISVPVIANKNSAMECKKGKNPLLSTKRRRGNANLVWDMRPIDKGMMPKLEKIISEIIGE